MLTRRSLFGILAGAVAAPIVVRSGLLMPVRALVVEPEFVWRTGTWTRHYVVTMVTRDDVILATDALKNTMIFPPTHGFKVGDIIRYAA